MTRQVMKPLYIATIRGQQLRFFRTPNDDGRPDLPWHCCEDLYRCMGLPREWRRHLQRWHFAKKVTRTVATADGLVTIAPHCMAQGAIGAWKEKGGANIEHEYAMEGSIALGKLTAGLAFPDQVGALGGRGSQAS